jgi:hypothetical protein
LSGNKGANGMSTLARRPIKKAFLYSLIASVSLSAVVAIVAILIGTWGWIQVRILLTMVTIAGASICGLACGAFLADRRGRTLPIAGIVLALSGAVLVIGGMWLDVKAESYWKLAASVSVLAVACAHLALLSKARLAEQFRWSLPTAYVVICGVAAIVVALIIAETQDDAMFRLLGVAAILDAAITVLIPIFDRLSKGQVGSGTAVAGTASRSGNWEKDPREVMEEEIAQLRLRLAELEARKRQLAR